MNHRLGFCIEVGVCVSLALGCDGKTVDEENGASTLRGASGAVDLALGERHSCALFDDGRVACWGSDQAGQLGNGDGSWGQRDLPSTVSQLDTVEQIAAGDEHNCARLKDGSVSCWGSNENGQLGDGSTEMRIAPARVIGLEGAAVFLAAGGDSTCAVLDTGSVQCWGDNTLGQSGGGEGSPDTLTEATTVAGVAGPAKSVAVGPTHSCAVLESGEVSCWGSNEEGGLGGGEALAHEGKHAPTAVLGIDGAAAEVGVMLDRTCVVNDDAVVFCAGYGFMGGEFNDGVVMEEVGDLPAALWGLSMDNGSMCAIDAAQNDPGSVFCWEFDRSDTLLTGRLGGSPGDVRLVEQGAEHGCLLDESGAIFCWGSDSSGQLGNGSESSTQDEPVPVGEVTDEDPVTSEAGEDVLRGTVWAMDEYSDEYRFDESAPTEQGVFDPTYATSSHYLFETETIPFAYFIGATTADGLIELTMSASGADQASYRVFKIEPHPSGSGRCLYLSDRGDSPEERPTTVTDTCLQEF